VKRLSAALLIFVAASAGAATQPYLVKDLNVTGPGVGSSNPYGFVTAGDRVYFWADKTMYRTDGTERGTTLVGVVGRQGVASTFPYVYSTAAFHNKLFFAGNDDSHGVELWKADDTGAEVIDLVPGPESSFPEDLTVAGDRLLFRRESSLWSSDGTAEGSHALTDANGDPIRAASLKAGTSTYALFTFDGGVWRTDGTAGGTQRLASILGVIDETVHIGETTFFRIAYAIYRTDGTAAGTSIVTPSTVTGFELGTLGDTLIFVGDDLEHGLELWKSDGTPQGTSVILDIVQGRRGSYPGSLTTIGHYVYFTTDLYEGTTQYRELWRTDGTARGTVELEENSDWGHNPKLGIALGNEALLIGAGSLWRSDGTPKGTVRLPLVSIPSRPFAELNGAIIFDGCDDRGCEPWRTRGTPESTVQLADIAPTTSTASSNPRQLTLALGKVFFLADGINETNHYAETKLWASDGTRFGTQVVRGDYFGSPSKILGGCGGLLYYLVEPNGLLATDGTFSGTRHIPIGDLFFTVILQQTACLGDTFYFFTTGANGGGLAYTRGTAATTGSLMQGFSNFPMVSWRGNVFFGAPFPVNSSLWMIDGVKDAVIQVTAAPRGPRAFVGSSSRAVFFTTIGATTLYSTDGTREGTVELLPIRSDQFMFLRVIEDVLYFIGPETSDGLQANSLWSSDGTPGGTKIVKTFAGTIDPEIASIGEVLYCVASGQLFRLDVRSRGVTATSLVGPVYGSNPHELTAVGNRLYFAYAHDTDPYATGARGTELWVSDGTPEGTTMFADIEPGREGSDPAELTVLGQKLIFSAQTKRYGRELWALDTTEFGRRRAASAP
jgi:ELWxxDGT repeat protein